jgi:hypothetical protein
VKPFEDIEWVEQHREWISALLEASSTSSEAAVENYQAIQAQWMLDHVQHRHRNEVKEPQRQGVCIFKGTSAPGQFFRKPIPSEAVHHLYPSRASSRPTEYLWDTAPV